MENPRKPGVECLIDATSKVCARAIGIITARKPIFILSIDSEPSRTFQFVKKYRVRVARASACIVGFSRRPVDRTQLCDAIVDGTATLRKRTDATNSMRPLIYPATFRPDETGRPIVTFPDFPRAHTDGKIMREAFEEATDCLGSVIAAHIAEKREIPEPSPIKRGQKLVPVPLWVAGKLALYLTMREQKITNSELSRRLGVRETVVRRMLDPNHATKSEKLQAALSVLGKRIAVALDDAAELRRHHRADSV